MRFTMLLVAALALTACSKAAPSGPAKIDPSVLLVNLTTDNVKLIWATDAGVDTIIVGPNTTHCERWLQSFDSLYVRIVDSSTSYPGAYADVTLPWLHFADYPYYFQLDTVYSPNGQNVAIAQHIVDTECQ